MNKGIVAEVCGDCYKVAIGGNISAPLPRLLLSENADNAYKLVPGDTVLVAFLSSGLSDGVILGRVSV